MPVASADNMGMAPDTQPPGTAVGALLAPVVACLRGDDAGLDVLLEGAFEDGVVDAALHSAPAVASVYLRLAPPPDGVDRIVRGYVDGALARFADRKIVTVGAECLQVAQLGEPLAEIGRVVFADAAREHGDECALRGAVACCWWCAQLSAALRASDPIAETAAICRYLARVA
ncbi:MAG: hypothetical protein ACT4OX_12610 [Actinomycetota bacterium]